MPKPSGVRSQHTQPRATTSELTAMRWRQHLRMGRAASWTGHPPVPPSTGCYRASDGPSKIPSIRRLIHRIHARSVVEILVRSCGLTGNLHRSHARAAGGPAATQGSQPACALRTGSAARRVLIGSIVGHRHKNATPSAISALCPLPPSGADIGPRLPRQRCPLCSLSARSYTYFRVIKFLRCQRVLCGQVWQLADRGFIWCPDSLIRPSIRISRTVSVENRTSRRCHASSGPSRGRPTSGKLLGFQRPLALRARATAFASSIRATASWGSRTRDARCRTWGRCSGGTALACRRMATA
jgi:hypothetical protein